MAAWLQLPRADKLNLQVPDAPGLCETCREAPAAPAVYCCRLCALFDAALDELAAALVAADGERMAPAVIAARTQLRAVAAVYDQPDGIARSVADDWADDVAAGVLLAVPFRQAVAQVRRLAAKPLPAATLDVADRT